jgi:hypothetical protein
MIEEVEVEEEEEAWQLGVPFSFNENIYSRLEMYLFMSG